MADAQVSQDAVEVLYQPVPIAQVTQDAVEVLYQPVPIAWVSQDTVEVVYGLAAPGPPAASGWRVGVIPIR